MSKVQIIDTAIANAGDQVFIPAVSFEGSEVFSGMFDLGNFDEEVGLGLYKKPDIDAYFLKVVCEIDGVNAEEGSVIELQIHCHPDLMVLNSGGGIETIRKIALIHSYAT